MRKAGASTDRRANMKLSVPGVEKAILGFEMATAQQHGKA
jgi:hypothetical protein